MFVDILTFSIATYLVSTKSNKLIDFIYLSLQQLFRGIGGPRRGKNLILLHANN